MRKLKSLWLVSVVLLLVSCSMSAKSDKSSEVGTASKGEVVTLNKAEFLQKVFNYEKNATKWVYEGDKPCIIDFYADWCGPCKMMGPVVEAMAELFDGKMKIGKLNVDDSQQTAAAYGVMSIPTFIFFKNGEKVQQSVGAVSKEELEQVIRNVIGE